MFLASHNSWSYLRPKKWWMRPLAFTARCQSVPVLSQVAYYGVRCLDLRIRFTKDNRLVVAHGLIEYDITEKALLQQLDLLDAFSERFGPLYVRVCHECRTRRQYVRSSTIAFADFCRYAEKTCPHITFWSGRNLYNTVREYVFRHADPSHEGRYASVAKPRLLDDWWPWLYARLHNRKALQQGTEKHLLMIDFVNLQ